MCFRIPSIHTHARTHAHTHTHTHTHMHAHKHTDLNSKTCITTVYQFILVVKDISIFSEFTLKRQFFLPPTKTNSISVSRHNSHISYSISYSITHVDHIRIMCVRNNRHGNNTWASTMPAKSLQR